MLPTNMVFLRLLLACVLLAAGLYADGEPHHTTAFIGDDGQIDVLNAFSTYRTRSFWNKHGQKRSTHSHFDRNTYFLYVEYALNRCNSVSFNGGYSMVDEKLNGRSRSLKDIELAWKHLINASPVSALTVQLTGIVPVGDRKPSIRYGQGGAQASLLYSRVYSLNGTSRLWYDLDLGYRWYTGYPSDQLRGSAALGLEISPAWWLIGSGQLEYSLSNGRVGTRWNAVTLHPNYRLFNAQLEAVRKLFSHTYITIGGYMHLWGEHVGAGGGFFGGAWLDF